MDELRALRDRLKSELDLVACPIVVAFDEERDIVPSDDGDAHGTPEEIVARCHKPDEDKVASIHVRPHLKRQLCGGIAYILYRSHRIPFDQLSDEGVDALVRSVKLRFLESDRNACIACMTEITELKRLTDDDVRALRETFYDRLKRFGRAAAKSEWKKLEMLPNKLFACHGCSAWRCPSCEIELTIARVRSSGTGGENRCPMCRGTE